MSEHKFFHEAVEHVRKKYGQGAIMRLSDNPVVRCQAISTGCLSIDIASGIGGMPKGRITEVFGAPHGGKSTLALQTAAQAQKEGLVAYIDVENALDLPYCQALGVDIDNLFLSQPDSAEDALEIAETIIRSGDVAMVVVDSVDALVPRAVIDGEMGQSLPALQARIMSQAMRKISGVVRKSGTVMLFINQVRMDLGGMGGYGGSPREVTSGGKALLFYASMRIDVRRTAFITDGASEQKVGQKVRVEFKKNKVAVPYKRVEVPLMFGHGFDAEADLLDLAVDCKVVAKAGAWFSYGATRLGQGRAFSAQFLREHPEVTVKIVAEVRQKKGLDVLLEEPEEPEDTDNEEEQNGL